MKSLSTLNEVGKYNNKKNPQLRRWEELATGDTIWNVSQLWKRGGGGEKTESPSTEGRGTIWKIPLTEKMGGHNMKSQLWRRRAKYEKPPPPHPNFDKLQAMMTNEGGRETTVEAQ